MNGFAPYPSALFQHRLADAIVHVLSLFTVGVICGLVCMKIADGIGLPKTVFSILYMLCLLGSTVASGIYHFGPWSHVRLALRRIDHAAIYLLIAATITAVLSGMDPLFLYIFAAFVWLLAFGAMLWKIFGSRVKGKGSTLSYIGLGVFGGVGLLFNFTDLPTSTAIAIFLGAGFYLAGVPFYVIKSMPYRYAIWHVFVLLGTISFFVGIFQVF
ncbi:MAG: hemolysin III family protein [Cohaesibacter sp.]|nr:hemolysin III family protein [Cohaesibacter sp.]MCV6600130.1 hemolysin III family protein [Cohaesibacter sp.]